MPKKKDIKTKQRYINTRDNLMLADPCSICGKTYKGFGNNAQPINSGRCCDNCNSDVIVRRLTLMLVHSGHHSGKFNSK